MNQGEQREEYEDGVEDARHRLGVECRHRRLTAEGGALSQTALARLLRTSKSTVSRIETGIGPIPPGIAARLDEVFETEGEFKELAEEITAGSFPVLNRRRMTMEREAIAIFEWSPTLVPGLFQTPEYARALFTCGLWRASAQEIASRVAGRIARQELLRSSPPPDMRVVLCESVIRRTVGGPKTMRSQLHALLSASSAPHVRLQILPLDAEPHVLMGGAVSILTTPSHMPVVCVEAFRLAAIYEDEERVRTALRGFNDMTSEALSARVSAELIRQQMESL